MSFSGFHYVKNWELYTCLHMSLIPREKAHRMTTGLDVRWVPVPEVLEKIVDAVLAYKPKPKSKAAKKRGRKAAKKGKAQADDSQ